MSAQLSRILAAYDALDEDRQQELADFAQQLMDEQRLANA